MTLKEYFAAHPRAALGFSGGVDSSFLLWAARESGAEVRPIFIKTPFQPDFELEDALRLGRELGVDVTVRQMELPGEVLDNPPDRCYHCKKAIFGTLRAMAEKEGFPLLLDGTNASDDPGDRPGMRALGELEVQSPLRICGLTKEEIRRRSREAGLFTWNKPAYACLATRFPAGTQITTQGLRQVETAEDLLMSMGFMNFRVRVFHGAARIQIPAEQMDRLMEQRETILARLRESFSGVMLDLEGRT